MLWRCKELDFLRRHDSSTAIPAQAEESKEAGTIAFPGPVTELEKDKWPTSAHWDVRRRQLGFLGKVTFLLQVGTEDLSTSSGTVILDTISWVRFLLQLPCSQDDYEASFEDGWKGRGEKLGAWWLHWATESSSPQVYLTTFPIMWENTFPCCGSQFESRFLKSNQLIWLYFCTEVFSGISMKGNSHRLAMSVRWRYEPLPACALLLLVLFLWPSLFLSEGI